MGSSAVPGNPIKRAEAAAARWFPFLYGPQLKALKLIRPPVRWNVESHHLDVKPHFVTPGGRKNAMRESVYRSSPISKS